MMRPELKFSRPLWKHQEDVLSRYWNQSEMALLHDCGTGKTTSAIGWLRTKYALTKQVIPTLIVSPVATLENWMEEFKRNSPPNVHEMCEILYGSGKDRLSALNESAAKIFITNPECFDMKPVVAAMKGKFRALVVDEVHRFKNPKSKRFSELLTVADSTMYRAILTGTPILNSYLDVWAQWRILDQGKTFGTNFFVFRERYFIDKNQRWKGQAKYFPDYVPIPGTENEIAKMLDTKASRVRKDQCLSLPPLVYTTEYVPLSSEQEKLYRAMERELVAEVKAGACTASNALVRVLRLLQILSGYAQLETSAHTIKDNPRLNRLSELLEELTPNHKVIVWSTFKANYAQIVEVCKELKLEYATLHGETDDRQEEIVKFQTDPKCRVMIANPRAGGLGVNLTASSYSIYYSRGYSLGDRLQSEARNHRGGSEVHQKITCIDLVAKNTLDEDVLAALLKKENFSDLVLDRLNSRC